MKLSHINQIEKNPNKKTVTPDVIFERNSKLVELSG